MFSKIDGNSNGYSDRFVFMANRKAIYDDEDILKAAPMMQEQLRQDGHKMLLEDRTLDREEFAEKLAGSAEKLGFSTIIKHRLNTGSLHDTDYNELRQAWKQCKDDDPAIDRYEEQMADRIHELVKVHYADPAAEQLWSVLRSGFQLTDLGCAERFAEEQKGEILFCQEQDRFFIWNGKIWVPDARNWAKAKLKAKQTIRGIEAEADATNNPELAKWSKGTETAGRLRSLLQAVSLDPQIQVAPHDFDSHKSKLNCVNGTVQLNRPVFTLYPHNPQDLLTKIVPWPYDPRARCPRWLTFLQQVTGEDQELQNFLQLAVGYGITGHVSEKCLFFLHGPGDTGKTTFIESVSTMLGHEYARTAGFTSFIRGVKSGIRNDLARLQGVRFVAAAEAAAEDKFDVVLLKRITGDDTVTARHLYREYKEFRPEFKIFLAANHAPRLPADDEAAWRRFIVIPFDAPIEKKEHDLKDRLREEMPGILAWAVRGAGRYYAEHFNQNRPLEKPQRVNEAIERYRARCEAEEVRGGEKSSEKAKRLIKQFVDECCDRAPGEHKTPEELLTALRSWCDEHFKDSSIITPNMFGRLLSQAGFESVTITRDGLNKRVWRDIKIK